MLPSLIYPSAKSEVAIAIYELAVDGWSNDYIARGLLTETHVVERELRTIRENDFKIERPSNTLHTFMRAIGIADVVSRYEFHTMKEMGFSTEDERNSNDGKAAEHKIVVAMAKQLGRSELWVRAMIRLYREYVVKPAREEIDGGKKTVKELVKAA